jgi:hypothetical protein
MKSGGGGPSGWFKNESKLDTARLWEDEQQPDTISDPRVEVKIIFIRNLED